MSGIDRVRCWLLQHDFESERYVQDGEKRFKIYCDRCGMVECDKRNVTIVVFE